jgi:hypothetical protein
MRGADSGIACEGKWHGVTDSAVGQPAFPAIANDTDRRKQSGDRGARRHDLVQRRTAIEPCPEITRLAGANVVTRDAERLHTVVQSIEAGGLQLTKPFRNDTAPSSQPALESVIEMHVEAVRQEVSAAKRLSVSNQLVEIESDSRVVRANDGARADTDEHIDRNPVTNQLSKHADMSGAAQPASAEDDPEANPLGHSRDSMRRAIFSTSAEARSFSETVCTTIEATISSAGRICT